MIIALVFFFIVINFVIVNLTHIYSRRIAMTMYQRQQYLDLFDERRRTMLTFKDGNYYELFDEISLHLSLIKSSLRALVVCESVLFIRQRKEWLESCYYFGFFVKQKNYLASTSRLHNSTHNNLTCSSIIEELNIILRTSFILL